jgi:hypothetical protein
VERYPFALSLLLLLLHSSIYLLKQKLRLLGRIIGLETIEVRYDWRTMQRS